MARALKARSAKPRLGPSRGAKASADARREWSAPGRVGTVDAARGIALCMMFVYHFAFDLRYYGLVRADFEHDPFWLGFRALIVTSFLVLVGVSLVLADRAGMAFPRFLRRLGVIAAGALLATLASLLLFPATFIYFGILHSIVVASLLAWPLRRQPAAAVVIGVVVLALSTLHWPEFDTRAWSWIGFTTHKPATEDYVPLVPWSAAVFAGIAAGHALVRTHFRALALFDRAPRGLRWLGRHSLIVYLVHQPVLFALIWPFAAR